MGNARRFLRGKTEGNGKLELICLIHFGMKKLKNVTCNDCADYKTGQCPGEGLDTKGCIECMGKHSETMEIGTNIEF